MSHAAYMECIADKFLKAETLSSKTFICLFFNTLVIIQTFTSCFYDLFHPYLILYRKAQFVFYTFELVSILCTFFLV